MENQDSSKYKSLFVIMAAIIVILEVIGAIDLLNQSYSGYQINRNNTITNVFPNSPAQKAGIIVGDQMKNDGGIDVKNYKELLQRPRASIGETRTYIFERNGETLSVDMTFAGLPAKEVTLSFTNAAIGFCFLTFGLWAFLKIGNNPTVLLVLVGICAAFDFIHHPYIASYTLRMIYRSFVSIIATFGFAFLLHFMVVFPKAKTLMEKKNKMIVLYGPMTLVNLFLLSIIIFQVENTSLIFKFARILFGVSVLSYIGSILVAMMHSYIKATLEERIMHGLKFILFGTILGFAPSVISGIIRFFAPTLALPGSEFYIVFIVLIPISLALACSKRQVISASATA
jgi:hypothetical protein